MAVFWSCFTVFVLGVVFIWRCCHIMCFSPAMWKAEVVETLIMVSFHLFKFVGISSSWFHAQIENHPASSPAFYFSVVFFLATVLCFYLTVTDIVYNILCTTISSDQATYQATYIVRYWVVLFVLMFDHWVAWLAAAAKTQTVTKLNRSQLQTEVCNMESKTNRIKK